MFCIFISMSLEAVMLLEELYVFSFCQEMEYWGIEELFITFHCTSATRSQKCKEGNHRKELGPEQQRHEYQLPL